MTPQQTEAILGMLQEHIEELYDAILSSIDIYTHLEDTGELPPEYYCDNSNENNTITGGNEVQESTPALTDSSSIDSDDSEEDSWDCRYAPRIHYSIDHLEEELELHDRHQDESDSDSDSDVDSDVEEDEDEDDEDDNLSWMDGDDGHVIAAY